MVDIFIALLVSACMFILGVGFGYYYFNTNNPIVGVLDVDDKSNPDKITWRINLDRKISPEEITKKSSVRFMVFHNGR